MPQGTLTMKRLMKAEAPKPKLSLNAGSTAKGRITKSIRHRNRNLLPDGLSPSNNPWLVKNIPQCSEFLNTSVEPDIRLNDRSYYPQESHLKSLIREYTILNARIIAEHSAVLTDSQLNEEQVLRQELFKLLRQKGVRL
jgi:hypothetical protein